MNEEYKTFLDNSGGIDPDFPGMDFSGGGKKVNGDNAAQSDYKGMESESLNDNVF